MKLRNQELERREKAYDGYDNKAKPDFDKQQKSRER